MKRGTIGTSIEIKHAFDHKIPTIAYLLTDHPDFQSGSFKYRVKEIAKSDDKLLEIIKKY